MRNFCSRMFQSVCVMFSIHVVSSHSYYGDINLKTKLGNRKYVVGISEVKHHVLIVYSNLYCSGSLLTSKIVVTAATCLFKYRGDGVVKVGADSITGFGQVIPIQDIKIHEYFKRLSSLDNDIALVILKNDVAFGDKVARVLLIEPDIVIPAGTSLYVSGWGGKNRTINSLIRTEIIVIGQSQCEETHSPFITNSNFCARYSQNERLNDNGGGAMYNNVMMGILSYGATKKVDPMVAIFTNVSYFNRWLKINTLKIINQYCYNSKNSASSLETNEYT